MSLGGGALVRPGTLTCSATLAAPQKYRGGDGRWRACLPPAGKGSAVAGTLLNGSSLSGLVRMVKEGSCPH